MGIKQLSKLIKEKCPKAVITRKATFYRGTKVAIDASLALYQFLIAVRTEGSTLAYGDLTTSHIVGMFYRTIRMVENGIVPVYVFDGKAPAMKAVELQKRGERRAKAEQILVAARLAEDKEEIGRQEKRKVKVDETHVSDCKRLFKLMGIPFVTAESESEAHCAFLCKSGAVGAVATEDMDALCFGTPVLLRNMNASQAKKLDIDEYRLDGILRGLDMTMESFIDMCILLGCDYCDTVKGIGYKGAYELVKKHGTIEKIVENEKVEVGENFDYKAARRIFNELSSAGEAGQFEIMYDDIDKNGLIEFLVKEKGFDEARVTSGIEKLIKTRDKSSQRRLDSFFKRI